MNGASFGLSPRPRFDDYTESRIPGGCDDCHAYQRLIRVDDGLYTLRIYHDDTCPTLAMKRGRA
ncbi:hypothetical protein [Agrococcus beijingensis]|uniref:hypothetical protein n=1 Tax=Agrococcus beijingensis TaxID=3068634 RepID=UPI002740D9F0|nr:hypothetical protein [Agrococcus sp. REN33]